MGSINLTCIVPKLSKVWYIYLTENVVIERTVTFERLA